MPNMYDGLFGWRDEEEAEARAAEKARRDQETEREAKEAFDTMMGDPEKTLDSIFKKFWGGIF